MQQWQNLRVASCFLGGFKACSTGGNTLSTATLDQSSWLGSSQPQGEAGIVVLIRHGITISTLVLCDHRLGQLSGCITQASLCSGQQLIGEETHNQSRDREQVSVECSATKEHLDPLPTLQGSVTVSEGERVYKPEAGGTGANMSSGQGRAAVFLTYSSCTELPARDQASQYSNMEGKGLGYCAPTPN